MSGLSLPSTQWPRFPYSMATGFQERERGSCQMSSQLGSEQVQCYFCPILLAKASPKASPWGGEVDSTLERKNGMQEREKICC